MKNLIFVFLLVFLLLELLVVFPNKVEKSNVEEEEKKGDSPQPEALIQNETSQKMDGVHLVESREGQQDWELFSDAAESQKGKVSWKLSKVKVLFFNQGRVEFTVTGDEGHIDAQSKDLHIKGRVKTLSANGYHLKTDYIEYSSKSREIRSPYRVELDGPPDSYGDGLKATGKGLLAQVDLGLIFLNEDVEASKKSSEKKQISIRSKRAEFSANSKLAKFYEDLQMTYDQMTLSGDKASFEWSEKSNIFDYVNIHGQVKVTDGKRVATSKSLNLNLIENKFIFSGLPKLIQDGDELLGEEITFLEGGKKVKVDKINARGKNIHLE